MNESPEAGAVTSAILRLDRPDMLDVGRRCRQVNDQAVHDEARIHAGSLDRNVFFLGEPIELFSQSGALQRRKSELLGRGNDIETSLRRGLELIVDRR